MGDLTFGEQVKIMLSRKGMTIKELAENIQEQTGKAMSRQNLTQRLGRDNFQEKDMRMIASILGCPFQLSIFPEEVMDDQETMKYREEVMSNLSSSKKKKTKEDKEEIGYQQEFVIDDSMEISVPEHEMTIGEVYEIHEELSEMEAEKKEAERAAQEAAKKAEEERIAAEERAAQEAAKKAEEERKAAEERAAQEAAKKAEEERIAAEERAAQEAAQKAEEERKAAEAAEVIEEAAAEEIMDAEPEVLVEEQQEAAEEAAEEIEEIEEVPEPAAEKKKDRFKTGFLRKLNMGSGKKHEEEREEVQEPVHKEKSTVSAKTQRFEPVIQHKDEAEDLEKGELNPYTGREYQSNSVRMHPNRIGYVQVYDRKRHGWTDMTEWAFLGYQERMKALLGKDYEPPIYLD